jgi:Hg(II)-responsive transcriptional regulator
VHDGKRGKAMKIGQLATEAGVNIQTIRYYERMRMLAPAGRTEGGFRKYEPSALDTVRFVKRAQNLGFSLKEIASLMSLRTASSSSCATVSTRADSKIKEIEAKMDDLRRLKKALEKLKAGCSTREEGAACPILHALSN